MSANLESTYSETAESFKAISHPQRIAILAYICNCENHSSRVKQIYTDLNLIQSDVSRHLSIMKKQHILNRIRKNGEVFFVLNLKNKVAKCIKNCIQN